MGWSLCPKRGAIQKINGLVEKKSKWAVLLTPDREFVLVSLWIFYFLCMKKLQKLFFTGRYFKGFCILEKIRVLLYEEA